ncbi:ankyrin repeat-containing domain protein [Trichoderma chlorosporum]
MPNPHDYTVGWICAIPAEYVAARAFLDEEHEGPDQVSENDNNDYTLGKIGKHSIVIAVLPHGEYGLASAASVARDMLHSFPNVRIGLLVGIGGGAPSLKHDIRLGDVVVGLSNIGNGGVVQFDFNAMQSQEYREIGFLNQTPALLRAAVNGLMAQYESNGNQIKETINHLLAEKPRLRRKYGRPEVTTDRLYRSQVIHPLNSDSSCAVVCGDNISSLIERPERSEDDNDPAIHYGLIASSNTLIEDALIRDELIAKKGVLCFETEAAGLMNHFPCLVIRGICDYSDSHKETYKEWQGYAAMTAATYAKDLLSRIAPNRIEAEKKINDLLSGLHEVTKQHRDIAEEHRDIAKEQLESLKKSANEMLSKEERECHQLFRLTSDSKDATYEWYKGRIDERVENTCLWFLEHEHYQKWLKQRSGPLLVTADPGCGKSVLAKYLIDHGLPQSATICYFFFKDQDQNTSRQALCALLHQLFLQKPQLIRHAMPKFRTEGQKLINSTNSLWEILWGALPEAGHTIIVFDALDECAEPEFEDLMRNVESQFRSDQSSSSGKREEESEAIGQEVNRVITYRVNQLPLSPQIKDYLEKRLQETPNRTYLWVYLVFNFIKQESFKKTLKGAESAIKTLPKSVNEAYEKILSKSKESSMVQRALSIILAASQPLTLSEMNIAMNINYTTQDNTTQTFDDLDLEDESDFKSRLRSWCGLFISIYHGKIYFLHQTAREFLLADMASPTAVPSAPLWHHSISMHQAHNILAELCVLYVNLYNSHLNATINQGKKFRYPTDKNAFFTYAATNWDNHFRKASVIDGAAIIPFTEKICQPGPWKYVATFERLGPPDWLPAQNATSLLVASYYGLRPIIKLLLEKGADIEMKGRIDGRTPLSWAAEQGHEAAVQLLLEKGAEIDAKDKKGQTSLLYAVKKEHEAITLLLLKKGADINAKDNKGQTSLLYAVKKEHEAITSLLLEKGADINVTDDKGWTPLLHAANSEREAIITLLLKKGADINTKDNKGQTPLLHAAQGGGEDIITLLLKKGADINTKDNNGWTPLLHAAQWGREAIITLLLEKGADIEAESGNKQRALLLAAEWRHTAIVKLLIERAAKIEAKDDKSWTPLSVAAREGHERAVKLLVDNGAEIETKDLEYGRTPLSWASYQGHEAVVKLLLDHGAEIETKDLYGRTPLLWASVAGHEAVVKLLLDNGAEIETRDPEYGRTPLLWASCEGREAVVKLLLDHGAEIETKDLYGRTPLLWTASLGRGVVVKLLIENGAELEVWDFNNQTPSLLASQHGYEAIAKLLLEKGGESKLLRIA